MDMGFNAIEKLKSDYTGKYVVVDDQTPELRRFKGMTGLVKTVNMSGRALVQFESRNNVGWYDIELDFLKVVDAPPPKTPESAKSPAAKPEMPAAPEAAPAAEPAKESLDDLFLDVFFAGALELTELVDGERKPGEGGSLKRFCEIYVGYLNENMSFYQMMGHFMLGGRLSPEATERLNPIMRELMDSIEANRGLFNYRQVKPFDTLLSRAAVESIMNLVVYVFSLGILGWMGYHVLPARPLVRKALDELQWLATHLRQAHPGLRTGFDLSDMSGYAYYSGPRYAVYGAGCSDALARGGRYDEVGAVFGRNQTIGMLNRRTQSKQRRYFLSVDSVTSC